MHFLIIDDNAEDREWLSDLATDCGAKQVDSFDKLEPALSQVEKTGADVILLDFRLDDQDGLSFFPGFRARAPQAKIVLVTGNEFRGLEDLCARFGVGFLSKSEAAADKLIAAIAEARQ